MNYAFDFKFRINERGCLLELYLLDSKVVNIQGQHRDGCELLEFTWTSHQVAYAAYWVLRKMNRLVLDYEKSTGRAFRENLIKTCVKIARDDLIEELMNAKATEEPMDKNHIMYFEPGSIVDEAVIHVFGPNFVNCCIEDLDDAQR